MFFTSAFTGWPQFLTKNVAQVFLSPEINLSNEFMKSMYRTSSTEKRTGKNLATNSGLCMLNGLCLQNANLQVIAHSCCPKCISRSLRVIEASFVPLNSGPALMTLSCNPTTKWLAQAYESLKICFLSFVYSTCDFQPALATRKQFRIEVATPVLLLHVSKSGYLWLFWIFECLNLEHHAHPKRL